MRERGLLKDERLHSYILYRPFWLDIGERKRVIKVYREIDIRQK